MGYRKEAVLEGLLATKRSWKVDLLAALLYLPSLFFGAFVRLRNFLYNHRLLAVKKSPLPVISVGNIVAGGVGKTPFTALLVQALLPFCRVAIVSRGYKSLSEKREAPLLVSRGAGPLVSWQEGGDEPVLLASLIPGAIVVVCKDRFKAIQRAQEEGAELIVLDDGMQHRQLHRDLEIVIVDGKDPLGGGYFLPRGFLRDEPNRLAKADLIVSRGKGSELCSFELIPQEVRSLEGECFSIEGKRVALFCGIARPFRFQETVEKMGAEVILTHWEGDHGVMSREALSKYAIKAQKAGATLLLCTEKDTIKMTEKGAFALPVAVLKTAPRLNGNERAFEALLEKAKKLLKPTSRS